PQAALEYQWLLSVLGGVGVLYGSLAALLQTNVRPMLAFASIGHVGLVLMGLASFTQQGWHGAILQVLHFILASGGIFLMAGFLHHRFNSTDVAYLGGLAKNMPLAAALFLFLGLAGLGAPLTAGFPAELLIYTATLRTSLGSVLVALTGQILAATYFITIYRRIFTGPLLHAASGQDLRQREILVALWFVVPILVLGIFPSLVLDLIAEPVRSWMAQGGFLLNK
ncbi:MAG: NADH-quinone oxidoreductase subunit M, partial [Magnetococcales bacterium]|nr:NADH-quinone oxidoreductase subunit M [Magnetococcales bacterium]